MGCGWGVHFYFLSFLLSFLLACLLSSINPSSSNSSIIPESLLTENNRKQKKRFLRECGVRGVTIMDAQQQPGGREEGKGGEKKERTKMRPKRRNRFQGKETAKPMHSEGVAAAARTGSATR